MKKGNLTLRMLEDIQREFHFTLDEIYSIENTNGLYFSFIIDTIEVNHLGQLHHLANPFNRGFKSIKIIRKIENSYSNNELDITKEIVDLIFNLRGMNEK